MASRLLLWFSILAGPAAWMAHLNLSYLLVAQECHGRLPNASTYLHLVTGLALGLTVLGGLAGAWLWTKTGGRLELSASGRVARFRFMALTGVIFSILMVILIVAGAVAVPVLDHCQRAHG